MQIKSDKGKIKVMFSIRFLDMFLHTWKKFSIWFVKFYLQQVAFESSDLEFNWSREFWCTRHDQQDWRSLPGSKNFECTTFYSVLLLTSLWVVIMNSYNWVLITMMIWRIGKFWVHQDNTFACAQTFWGSKTNHGTQVAMCLEKDNL